MNSKSLNLKIVETTLFVVIWASIFTIPFFTNRFGNQIGWDMVFKEWIRMFSYMLIFLLNFYWLVPRYLFNKRYVVYGITTIVLILFVFGLSILFRDYLFPRPIAMPRMDLGPGMAPMELGSGMPAPIGYNPEIMPAEKSIWMIFFDNLLISILVVGAGTSISLISKWLKEENRRKDVEKEQLKTELAFLRHQVSPHFFMNTLNNIHALIDFNTEAAKDAIIRLSTLMRYLLYETSHGTTSLKKEIDFIESYISLMQLRFSKKVKINVEMPARIPDIQIPPMLFVSFLENAFKHGVSYQNESFVFFKIEVNEARLLCEVRNSKHQHKEVVDKEHSGIGLSNIKKSLTLLFGDDYLLDITENSQEHRVQLSIPIT